MASSYARRRSASKAFRPARYALAETVVCLLLRCVGGRSGIGARGLLRMMMRALVVVGGLLRGRSGHRVSSRCLVSRSSLRRRGGRSSSGGCRSGRRGLSENRSSSQGSNQGGGHQGELHSVSIGGLLGVKRVCASAREPYEAGCANATPFSHETIESSAFFSVMRQMHRTSRRHYARPTPNGAQAGT